MKRILITGAGSYVGTSVERYLQEYNSSQCRELYRIDTLPSNEGRSNGISISHPMNAVFHVARHRHARYKRPISEETQMALLQRKL